jgi:predicted metal-dependent enzyme (double-stranded beta helix superfamily)
MSATSPIRDPRENPARLREFVVGLARTLESANDEAAILDAGRALLGALVAHDDWLPDDYAAPDPSRYQQYLLHCDSRERFSVVSFVWGPGQSTPVHDHRVWGLVGVLRGAEWSQAFSRNAPGDLLASGPREWLGPGSVSAVSPRIGDIHRVSNAYADRTSISIHVYGGNIGAVERATYDATGQPKRFVSGYANRRLPNLWDRSSNA